MSRWTRRIWKGWSSENEALEGETGSFPPMTMRLSWMGHPIRCAEDDALFR